MRLRLTIAILLSLTPTLVGCPSFEDELTGRYVQVLGDDLTKRPDVVHTIDFFRFGTNAQAVLRVFERSERNTADNPFAVESNCVWTRSAPLDENTGEFNLFIPASAQRRQTILKGRVADDGSMETRLERGQESVDLQLLLDADASPGTRCDAVQDRPLQVEFSSEDELGPDANHRIANPAFALVWVGVEPIEIAGTIQFAPLNDVSQAVRLLSYNVIRDGLSLQGNVTVLVPPPADKMLVTSGTTRFAFAHPVVIDDEPGDEDAFSWSVGSEPIVASAVGNGRREKSPALANGSGKALLFVEGRLSALGSGVLSNLSIIDAEGQRRPVSRDFERDDAHFFVVDIDYYNETVLQIDVPYEAQVVPIKLRVTELFLNEGQNVLPRVFALGGG